MYDSNVTFTCTVHSLTVSNITWSTNATSSISSQPVVITNNNNTYKSVLTLTQVTFDNIGTYTCIAINEEGKNTTAAGLSIYGKQMNRRKNIVPSLHSQCYYSLLSCSTTTYHTPYTRHECNNWSKCNLYL